MRVLSRTNATRATLTFCPRIAYKAFMTACHHIIDSFGGLTALSRALGHKHVTTVQGWKQRGIIPAHRQQEVLNAARRLGIDMSPADFFEAAEAESERNEERAA